MPMPPKAAEIALPTVIENERRSRKMSEKQLRMPATRCELVFSLTISISKGMVDSQMPQVGPFWQR